jgi:hypothetical protein
MREERRMVGNLITMLDKTVDLRRGPGHYRYSCWLSYVVPASIRNESGDDQLNRTGLWVVLGKRTMQWLRLENLK